MDSIVNLLLLVGVGFVILIVVAAFIARGKRKDLHNDPAAKQRADAYAKDAPDASNEEK